MFFKVKICYYSSINYSQQEGFSWLSETVSNYKLNCTCFYMLALKTKYGLSRYLEGFEDPYGFCVMDLFWIALFFHGYFDMFGNHCSLWKHLILKTFYAGNEIAAYLESRNINFKSKLALNINMLLWSLISVIALGGKDWPTATSPTIW